MIEKRQAAFIKYGKDSQPRSQGLSSYHPLERTCAPGGSKMRDPGNEVERFAGVSNVALLKQRSALIMTTKWTV